MTRSRYQKPERAVAATSLPETRRQTGSKDHPIVYLSRRILTRTDQMVTQGVYVVKAGDRIDLISQRLLGDPALYWLIAEVNGAADPTTLCRVPGRRLLVPAALGQPQGGLDQPKTPILAEGGPAGAIDDDAED